MLFAVDDIQAVYNHTSLYRNPQFEGIKPWHLSLPRLILEYASGKKHFVSPILFSVPIRNLTNSYTLNTTATRRHPRRPLFLVHRLLSPTRAPRSARHPTRPALRTIRQTQTSTRRVRERPIEHTRAAAAAGERGGGDIRGVAEGQRGVFSCVSLSWCLFF